MDSWKEINETPEGYKQYYLFDHPVDDPIEFKRAAPYNNALKVSLQNIPDAAGKTFYMYTASKYPRLAGIVRVKSQDKGICDFTFTPQTEEDSEVTPYKKEETVENESSFIDLVEASVKPPVNLNDVSAIARKIKREVDKYEKGGPAGNQNCQLCTQCFELQCRGVNELPRPVYSPRDPALKVEGHRIVKGGKKEKFSSVEDLEQLVLSAGNGARFYVHVNWKGGIGGHEWVAVNIDGTAYAVDPQNGTVAEISKAKYITNDEINFNNSYTVRMDNKQLDRSVMKYNDRKYLVEWDDEKDVAYLKQEEKNFNEATTTNRSTVYYTREITPDALVRIYKALGRPLTGKTLVKISTGEPGGHNYLKPELIGKLVHTVNGTIGDANTAYKGKRQKTKDHWEAIKLHGFDRIAECDILDADGETPLPVTNGYHLKQVLVGSHIPNYDSFLILSHFKGHTMAGYGGALKNVAIGFASSHGKCLVHSSGESDDTIKGNHTHFLESMVDSFSGSAKLMGNSVIYINVANRLSVDCDCDSHPAEPTMGDLGIYASLDPVAVDQACIDAVYSAKDSKDLRRRIESRDGLHTLACAEKAGLGSRVYNLVDIDRMNETAYTPNGRRPKNYHEEEGEPTTIDSVIAFAKENGLSPLWDDFDVDDAVEDSVNEANNFMTVHDLKSNPSNWDEFKAYWVEKRKLFRSNMWDTRDVDEKSYEIYQQYHATMSEDNVDYDVYKQCFDRFCDLFSLVPAVTIIENLYFEHDTETGAYTVFMRYSTGIVKVHIPEEIELTHASPVENIEALIPTFKSKTKGKYFYPDDRIYFTIRKRIASNKAGLEDMKLYKYTPKEYISEAYIDPTYTRFSDGAIYIRTDNPIEVEPVKVHHKAKELSEAAKLKKEEVIKNHLRTNAMAYNGMLYIPDYLEQVKKMYGMPIFDFFYPSFRIFSFETRKATSIGGLYDNKQYDPRKNWYKVSINDDQHNSFCKQVAELIQKMISGEPIEPGDLDLATEWKDEIVYHKDLMRDTEPYSQAYLKQCQYLHDLFWDPFDDPDDTSAICQNIIAFCRLIDPKLIGSVNETDGMITKQSLEQYIASEITDDRIFLLKKKRKYPIINKESIKFAMDNIDSVDKKDVREYVKNLNKFIEQYAYPYAITVDHPYAKYAPKKIILPVTMTESGW